jgi:hypothetical protein
VKAPAALEPLLGLLGQDAHLLDAWIDFHEETGRVVPLPELDRATRARVRLVIFALRLNDGRRRQARRRLLRMLQRAWKIGDLRSVKEALAQGPYRFIGRKFLASKRPSRATPSPESSG